MNYAGTIAARRMLGQFRRNRLSIDLDGTVNDWGNNREFGSIDQVFPVLHREAYRGLRMRVGVSPNKSTWEWHQIIK